MSPQKPSETVSSQVKAQVSACLHSMRSKMIAFANMQLGDAALAEDLVQEALLGALKNADAFRGEAAFKTWVFSILKRKIADHFRKSKITPTAHSQPQEQNLDLLFDHKGQWHPQFRPPSWGEPELELANTQFWIIFDICLNELPERQCTMFMMREYIGLSPAEIRRALDLSTISIVNVTLHRARFRLQQCLSARWFGEQK